MKRKNLTLEEEIHKELCRTGRYSPDAPLTHCYSMRFKSKFFCADATHILVKKVLDYEAEKFAEKL